MTATTEPTTTRRRPTDAAADDETSLNKEASRSVRRRSMRLLGDLLRPHKKALAWAAVLVVASTLGVVAGPWLVAEAIDRAVPALRAGSATPLVLIGAGYLAAAILGGVAAGAY